MYRNNIKMWMRKKLILKEIARKEDNRKMRMSGQIVIQFEDINFFYYYVDKSPGVFCRTQNAERRTLNDGQRYIVTTLTVNKS